MANTNELKFQISAEDKASKTLENIQKRLDTLDGVLKNGLKGLKLDIDDKTFKSALKQVISDINNNPYKIKLGVNKSVFRSAISDAIKSISEKPFKLPLNVNIKQKDINSAIGNIETSGLSKALNVKLNLDATQAFRTLASVIKNLQQIQKLAGDMKVNVDANVKTMSSGSGTGSSSKLGGKSLDAKIEKEYESLLQKRNKAMSDMDKAYQASNDNSKDIRFLKSRKEFFKAQDRLMKFYNESGMTDSKSMVRDLEKRAGLYSENSPIRASIMKALDTANIRLAQSPDLNIVRRESASDAHNTKLLEYQKLANNNKIKEQADKEVEQQKLLNEYLKAQQQLEDARLKKMRDEEIAAQKLVNAYQKQLELQARQSASWNRVERQRDKINKNKDIQDTKDLLKQQAETLKIKTQIDDKDLKQFIKDLEKLRNLTNNTSLNFYQNMAKNLGIGNETALAKAMRQQQQDLQKQFQSNWWKQDGTLTQGSQQIPTSAKQVKSTYQSMAAEAKKYAQQAEMAWRNAGNKSSESFEKYRDKFQKQMEKMVDFRKNLGNLSYGAEANIFSNMARSVGQANPVYDSLISRVKSLREAQERYRREVETTNERLRRELREQGRARGFSGGRGSSEYSRGTFFSGVIQFLGRSSKGFGSFMEAISRVSDNMMAMGGTIGKTGAAFAFIGATVFSAITAFNLSYDSVKQFGDILIQVGNAIYKAFKPGIDLFNQKTKAELALGAGARSMATIDGRQITDEESKSIGRQLTNRAIIDAAKSVFNPSELIDAMQGTMPMLFARGMSAEQAYQVTKGVASVAKLGRLAPNQVLQETRDLAQGSITARTSQVANLLGISNEDIEQYKGDADALYAYLMEKFKEYSKALDEYAKTPIGAFEQLEETIAIAGDSIVSKLAQPFVEVFNTITNSLGSFVDEQGHKLDENGQYLDEYGNKLDAVGEVSYQVSEPLQNFADALEEIIEYLLQAIDELFEYSGITEDSKTVTEKFVEVMEFLIDAFVVSIKAIKESAQTVIKFGKAVEFIAVPVLEFLYRMVNLVRIAITGWQDLFTLIGAGTGSVRPEDAFKRLEESEKLRQDLIAENEKGYASTFSEFFKSHGLAQSVTDGALVTAYKDGRQRAEREARDRGSVYADLGNVQGKGKSDTKDLEKANKDAIKQSQKMLKERLSELKNALADALEDLKDVLEKNKIAYEEGFMSMKDYFTQKADIERQEAELKLAESMEELSAINESLFDNEYDRLKALHEVERNIRKYSKEVEKTTRQQKEVARNIAKATTAQNKLLQAYSKMLKQGSVLQNNNVQSSRVSSSSNVVSQSSLQSWASNNGISSDIVEEVVKQAVEKYGENADNYIKMTLAMMMQESGGNQDAISSAGAIGLMQLMPDTASGLGVDPYDWKENIAGGLIYIDELAKQFGWDVEKIIAAYNAGPQAVIDYGGIPPYEETQNHVNIVKGYYDELSSLGSSYSVSDVTSNTGREIVDNIGNLIAYSAYDYVKDEVPYSWGGIDKSGVDCSGLVYSIYKALGIDIARMADDQADQIASKGGFFEDASKLMVGDLVFMQGSSPGDNGVGHVGIYTGQGKYVHAPGSGQNVKYANLSDRSDIVGYGSVRILTGQFKDLSEQVSQVTEDIVGLSDGTQSISSVIDGAISALTDSSGNLIGYTPNEQYSLGGLDTRYMKFQDMSGGVEEQISGLQDEVKASINLIAKEFHELTGDFIEWSSFTGSSLHSTSEWGHYAGWKADANISDALYDILKQILTKYGIAAGIEDVGTDNQHVDMSWAKGYVGGPDRGGYYLTDYETGEDFYNRSRDAVAKADIAISNASQKLMDLSDDITDISKLPYDIVSQVNKVMEDLGITDVPIADTTRLAQEYRSSVQKLTTETINLQADHLSRITGNTEGVLLKLYNDMFNDISKHRSGSDEDRAYLQARAYKFQDDYLDAVKNNIETALEFNLDTIESNAKLRNIDIYSGKYSFKDLTDKYYSYFTDVNNKNGLAGFIKQLEDLFVQYTNRGFLKEAVEIRERIEDAKKSLYEMFDSWIEQGQKYWDNAEAIFNATDRFTPTQREFAEREFNAYRAQREYADRAQKGNILETDYKKNIKELTTLNKLSQSLNKNSKEYAENQERINYLVSDTKRLETLIRENEQLKRLAELTSKMPDYLDDLKKTARDALDNGLTEFLTDGILEAESLGDALRDLAYNVLKEIQEISAKWIVKGLMNSLFGQFNVDEEMPISDEEMPISDDGYLIEINNTLLTGFDSVVAAIYGQGINGISSTMTPTLMGTVSPYTSSLGSLVSAMGPLVGTMTGLPVQGLFGMTGDAISSYGDDIVVSAIDNLTDTIMSESSEIFAQLSDVVNSINIASVDSQEGLDELLNEQTYHNSTAEGQLDESVEESYNIDSNTLASSGFMGTLMRIAGTVTRAYIRNKGRSERASGGLITGPGTDTSDSIPAMLSNGEYVINAKAVKKYGSILDLINNGTFEFSKFASGGIVDDANYSMAQQDVNIDNPIEILKEISSQLSSIISYISSIAKRLGVTETEEGNVNISGTEFSGEYESYGGTHEFSKSSGKYVNKFISWLGLGTDMSDNRLVDQLGDDVPKSTKMMVDLLQVIADNSFEIINILGIQLVQSFVSMFTRHLFGFSKGGVIKLAKGGAVYHNNGLITGQGSSTSDSIPAMLSNGEAVLNAKAVKELGLNFISAVNNGQFAKIKAKLPHFADGGFMGEAYQSTARGMTDFAKNIGSSVTTNNQMNIALVRNEEESLEFFMRSPRGQKILVDFAKGNGRVFSRFNNSF